jgi:hypothetical protein
MVLGPISMVSGYLLLAGRRRRPALLASLGWLVIDALYFLETGQPFVLGFWLLPLPFLLWGSWAGRPARYSGADCIPPSSTDLRSNGG